MVSPETVGLEDVVREFWSPDEPGRLVELVERDGGDVDRDVDDGTVQLQLRQRLANHVPVGREEGSC